MTPALILFLIIFLINLFMRSRVLYEDGKTTTFKMTEVIENYLHGGANNDSIGR